jgi:peptidoglycan/xylan/chitin deacetylase (PgdA/CDA1 family)
MNQFPRVALKVDCDTYVGTREGLPRLGEILSRRGIRATFFFTFGPDRSGVAVRRIFTRPGFLKKMLRSRAASLYGFRTALYGTLLPSPLIGERCAGPMREAAGAGHETGVHGAYEAIFGHPARAAAAAGWTVNGRSLEVEAERGLLYTSNTRGGAPFFPRVAGRPFSTLEIPSTLPTLDETLAWPELSTDQDQRHFFREAVTGTDVHTIHAEVEGRSKAGLFEAILDDWLEAGARFPLLSELAQESLARREAIPSRSVVRTTLPGRGGTVATGWPSGGR